MEFNKQPIVALIAVGALFTGMHASAATIANYDFDGLDSVDTEVNTTAGDMDDYSTQNGGATNPNTNRNLLGSINGTVGNPTPAIDGQFQTFSHNTGNLAGSLSDEVYIEFVITPGASVSIDYTQVTVDMQKDGGGGAAVNAHLLVDQNSNGWDTGDELSSDTFSNNGPWVTLTLDASTLANVTTATTFRVYFWTPGSGAANGLNADNIVVTGDVTVIPEPGSLALLGLGGLLVARRRRG